jgi:hypothetical protein
MSAATAKTPQAAQSPWISPLEIVIVGVTLAGKTFRPSDWAERLCGVVSIFGEDQRINYSPYVKPILSAEVKCVIVDCRLQELNPEAFEFLLGFARDNELKLHSWREQAAASGQVGAASAGL